MRALRSLLGRDKKDSGQAAQEAQFQSELNALKAQNAKAASDRDAAIKREQDVANARDAEAAAIKAEQDRIRRKGGKRGILTFTESGDSGVLSGLSSVLGG